MQSFRAVRTKAPARLGVYEFTDVAFVFDVGADDDAVHLCHQFGQVDLWWPRSDKQRRIGHGSPDLGDGLIGWRRPVAGPETMRASAMPRCHRSEAAS